MFQRGVDTVATLGTLFWDYSVYSYSGVGITEHTEYQFPKEQTLCYSENRIGDVARCGWVGAREMSLLITVQSVLYVSFSACVYAEFKVQREKRETKEKRQKQSEKDRVRHR